MYVCIYVHSQNCHKCSYLKVSVSNKDYIYIYIYLISGDKQVPFRKQGGEKRQFSDNSFISKLQDSRLTCVVYLCICESLDSMLTHAKPCVGESLDSSGTVMIQARFQCL